MFLFLEGWEKAVAGLMVTSALLMGLVVIFSGYLMLRTNGKSGILSDVSPVIIGNIAGEHFVDAFRTCILISK